MSDETNTAQPDLEKARDEKCAPLAQKIISDMGSLTAGEDGKVSLDPVVTSAMNSFLAADVNIETEAPYVFQLILKTFSELNTAAQTMTLTGVDSSRYDRIKAQVLTHLANDGDQANTNIATLFQSETLSAIEVKYILEDMLTSLSAIQDGVIGKIGFAVELAEAKLFGVDTMHDLSMSVLDKVLGGTGTPETTEPVAPVEPETQATPETAPEAASTAEEPAAAPETPTDPTPDGEAPTDTTQQ